MRQLEKIKTVPEAMSNNDLASYFVPHDFLDNVKWSRARMSRDMSELQSVDGGAKVGLVLGISAPRTPYK